jgi:hypothetical protein
MFQKYSIIPATQNKDEQLFSMVSRNTQPITRSIKAEMIDTKVVVGTAIRSHRFIFDYFDGDRSNSPDGARLVDPRLV